MRLIDADALKARAIRCSTIRLGDTPVFFKAVGTKEIDKAPTVDAVEVVRCKDCKYKGWVQEPCHGKSVDCCHVWDCTLRNLDKTFCSYGERKENT